MIKIGNIASGAADFVLQTGNSLSSSSSTASPRSRRTSTSSSSTASTSPAWRCSRSTRRARQAGRTLSLAGSRATRLRVPNGSYSSLVGSLPTDTFDPVALPSQWTSLFANPAGGGANTPTSADAQQRPVGDLRGLQRRSRSRTRRSRASSPGRSGRSSTATGRSTSSRPSSTRTATRSSSSAASSGRTTSQPISFELEVVGGVTIYDPSTLSAAARPSGCTWTAASCSGSPRRRRRSSSPPAAASTRSGSSGRMTGLLIASYDTRPSSTPGYVGVGPRRCSRSQIGVGIPPSGLERRPRRPQRHHGHLHVPGQRQGDVEHDAAGRDLHRPAGVPRRPAERLPVDDHDHARRPEIDGSTSHSNSVGFYIQAVVTGTITLENVITLSGMIGVTAPGRDAELRPDPGRRQHQHPVPRLAVGLDRPRLLHVETRRHRPADQPGDRRPGDAGAQLERDPGGDPLRSLPARGEPVPQRPDVTADGAADDHVPHEPRRQPPD